MKWFCWFVHDWTKWEISKEFCGIDWQKRECKRCGYSQEKSVGAY